MGPWWTPERAPPGAAGSGPTTPCPPRPAARWWPSLAPEGIVAEALDVYGQVVARAQAPVTRHPGPGRSPSAATLPPRWPARSRSPSSAPPIPWTGRAAGSSTSGRAVPARRARRARPAGRPGRRSRHGRQRCQLGGPRRAPPGFRRADFVYLFLGEGLGCAVLTDGEVRRGHAGWPARSPTWSRSAPAGRRCG